MTDPVALSMPPVEAAATSGAHASPQRALDPVETRMFARMMQGVVPPAEGVGGAPGALHDAAAAYASQLSGNVRSFEDMRRGLLESLDYTDPIKSMFVLTDYTMQAQVMFTKLHISTGLASAATSLFGTLLRNQQ